MSDRVLTDALIRRLKPAQPGTRYEVSCRQTPHLVVRVSDHGRKSLMLRARLRPNANPTRLLLGVHDAVLVDDAKELAREYLAASQKERAGTYVLNGSESFRALYPIRVAASAETISAMRVNCHPRR